MNTAKAFKHGYLSKLAGDKDPSLAGDIGIGAAGLGAAPFTGAGGAMLGGIIHAKRNGYVLPERLDELVGALNKAEKSIKIGAYAGTAAPALLAAALIWHRHNKNK